MPDVSPAFSPNAFPPVMSSIDDVITQLDFIIHTARRRGSADGYFAALYRRVTETVKLRITQGAFEDGPRMAKFDVTFASRYICAWHQHERHETPTSAWAVALSCETAFWPVVLQHLLLGMNAHINLDLGIVAAEISPGPSIHGLKNDFDAINQLLSDLVGNVVDRMGTIWPGVRLLVKAGGGLDEDVVNFSLHRAREAAWDVATRLAAEPDAVRRAAIIQEVDDIATLLGRGVLHPGLWAATTLAWVRLRERGSVAEKLDVLSK
ncbi:MAG TPA: DUF5995 family protein [Lacunisphaera sp.]|jgi:hypothetical protein